MSLEESEIRSALESHERAKSRLAAELQELDNPGDHQAIYVSAQILRHRIEMALLASRLTVAAGD